MGRVLVYDGEVVPDLNHEKSSFQLPERHDLG
jgi:hypothetical protein